MTAAAVGGVGWRCLPTLGPRGCAGARRTPAQHPWCAHSRRSRRCDRRSSPSVRGVVSSVPMTWPSAAMAQSSLSVYVHWPYCQALCSYCDFNKYVAEADQEKMARCLATEAKTMLGMCDHTNVSTVFFGGGTPSLMAPSTIQAVLQAIDATVPLHVNAEVSLECNPESLTPSRLDDFCAVGVNRVSIGVQSLDDRCLASLNRQHTAKEALRVVEAAKSVLGDAVSVDMMCGLPGQDVLAFATGLEQLMQTTDPAHLSVYGLTLAKGTPLYKAVDAGQISVPPDQSYAHYAAACLDVVSRGGLEQYEVSNYSKPGCQSLHNMRYWLATDFVGLGPGAHGRFATRDTARLLSVQAPLPKHWIKSVEETGHGARRRESLDAAAHLEETLVMGLRMCAGLSHKHWESRSGGRSIEDVFGGSSRFWAAVNDGLLVFDAQGLRASPRGMLVLDAISSELLAALDASLANLGSSASPS
eukprot:m.428177 g.428177  ORF g.428177 m.428177 type:complete len:472 (+) comp20231_c1_seq15:118-1533(+)